MVPLIISNGLVLHDKFYSFLKTAIPDRDQRKGLLTDIAVAFARGRGQLYSHPTLVAQVAADET